MGWEHGGGYMSEYLLYIVLLIIEYVCYLSDQEISAHINTIPFRLSSLLFCRIPVT